jgi:phosphoribosylanthranilate isomerase
MSIAVKICGLTSAEAVDAAVAAGAAYGGLVFHRRSPRYLGAEAARALAARMRGRLKIVALVADMDDGELETVIAAVAPDFLQLHGAEDVARTAAIRARFGLPVIKALAVADNADLDAVRGFEDAADMLLFDARPPDGAERRGGHGAAFDWRILAGHSFTKPWFLAGGLSPDNVARAIQLSGARQVDTSSGVESAPGVKDVAAIAAFVAAACPQVAA